MTFETTLTPSDLLSSEEYQQYSVLPYPDNLTVLHERLKAKLKEEPDYEIWVPFVHYRLTSHLKTEGTSEFLPKDIYVSSRGRVMSYRGQVPIEFSRHIASGYYRISIYTPRSECFRIHRVMACSFIPIPEELAGMHPRDLHVNHLNANKLDIDLGNLEWTTPAGNAQHAIKSNLRTSPTGMQRPDVKPVKGTVLSGEHAGYEFVLTGTKAVRRYGFDQQNVSKCALGQRASHKGCSWVFATELEIETLPRKPINFEGESMTVVCWDTNTLAADTLYVAGTRKMQGGYEKILLPEEAEWTVQGHSVLAVGFAGAVACMAKVRKLLETNVVIGTNPDVDGDSFSLIMITDKKVSYYWNTGTTANGELVNELFIVEGNHAVGSGAPYGMGVMAIKGDAISGVKGAIKVDLHSGGYIDTWSFDTPRALTRINPTTGEIISTKQLPPVPKKKDAILCAPGG